MKDAVRNVEVKIFKAVLTTDKKKYITYYFTSRVEIGFCKDKGNSSVYEKLESVRGILNAGNLKGCDESGS